MADDHSQPQSSSSQRIPAAQPYHWQEQLGPAREEEDPNWMKRSTYSKHNRSKLQRSRSPASSDASSNEPEFGLGLDHPSPVEALPMFPHTITSITPWNPSTLNSDSSLETYYTTLELPSGMFQNPFGSGKMSVSGAEARAPSPRSQMSVFRAVRQVRPTTIHVGPLDRFLAQEDDLVDFGNDLKRVEEEWKRLRVLRANVLRLRSQLQSKRKDLQEKQEEKDRADGVFMKFVRECRPGNSMSPSSSFPERLQSPDKILESCYTAMQAARDEYGPLEYEYNILENRLDEEEFELAKIEGRLYQARVNDSPFLGSNTPALDELPPQPSADSFLGLSTDTIEEYHPLHANYLSRLGDLDLARERHMGMIQERENILSSRDFQTHLGIAINQEDQDFLTHFPELEAALEKEIAQIEEDVERCRLKCIENGIELHESAGGSQYESDDKGSHIVATEDEIILQEPLDNTPQSSMFPVLLPGSDEEKDKLGFLITNFDEGNKSDRINRWILYQLQTSPLEVELLLRVSLRFLQLIDLWKWQMCVLSWWPLDDANKSPETFEGTRTTSSTTHSSNVSRDRYYFKPKIPISNPDLSTRISHRRTQSCPSSISLDMIPRDPVL